MVTSQFQKFNGNFKKLEQVVKEVTSKKFEARQKLSVQEMKNDEVHYAGEKHKLNVIIIIIIIIRGCS